MAKGFATRPVPAVQRLLHYSVDRQGPLIVSLQCRPSLHVVLAVLPRPFGDLEPRAFGKFFVDLLCLGRIIAADMRVQEIPQG